MLFVTSQSQKMIPKETVDRIFDTARIDEVVGEFVSLKKRGGSIWITAKRAKKRTIASQAFHLIRIKRQRAQVVFFGAVEILQMLQKDGIVAKDPLDSSGQALPREDRPSIFSQVPHRIFQP